MTVLVFCVLSVLVLRHSVGHWVRIHGESMSPTLTEGTIRFMSTLTQFNVGDLVLVRGEGRHVVRRLVGLTGDRISLRHGRLTLNGTLVSGRQIFQGEQALHAAQMTLLESVGNDRPYAVVVPGRSATQSKKLTLREVTVPQNAVFLLCDNRAECPIDSFFGLTKTTRIIGVIRESAWPSF